jgi:hypothetical protein
MERPSRPLGIDEEEKQNAAGFLSRFHNEDQLALWGIWGMLG